MSEKNKSLEARQDELAEIVLEIAQRTGLALSVVFFEIPKTGGASVAQIPSLAAYMGPASAERAFNYEAARILQAQAESSQAIHHLSNVTMPRPRKSASPLRWNVTG